MVSKQKKISKNQQRVKSLLTRALPQKPKISKSRRRAKRMAGGRMVPVSQQVPAFGPVSTIDTAPVSIGNTVQGCSPIVVPTADGVRVRGRDFLVTANATATSVTGWCLIGGAPLTPECMSASVLKGYCNSYAEYQIHGVALHFVTSSTTADAGSILLYIGKDRAGPGLNPTAANLLPFVLSDHGTVISPVWKNASAVYHPAPKWYTTGLGNDEALSEQGPGELFVLSKVTEANSPGYILMDYDITFRNMQVNIKSLTFPVTRMKYTECNMTWNQTAPQAGVTVVTPQLDINNLLDGTTLSTPPVGWVRGDIYKIVITTTNAVIGGPGTLATVLSYTIGSVTNDPIPIVDGLTLYGTIVNSYPNLELFPTYTAAVSGANPITWGYTTGGAPSNSLHVFMSFVGSAVGTVLQANY